MRSVQSRILFRSRTRAALAGISAVGLVAALAWAMPLAASAAPAPTSDTAVITVHTGGVRTAVGSVAPLEGVVLQLLRDDNGNSQGSPTGTALLTCTSDATGECDFVVDDDLLNTQANRQFWIIQPSGAAGFEPGSPAAEHYFSNLELVTGLNTSNFQGTQYRAYISGVTPNTAYVSGVDFMTRTSNNDDGNERRFSSGTWQNSFDNPPSLARCALKLAVLSDLSSSVAGDPLDDLKDAATAFVNALAGTSSEISLFTFGTEAPAPGPNNSTLLDRSALIPAQVSELTAKIAGYSVPSGSYTNWDAGLWQLVGGGYDQVIVITDGNPTAYGEDSTTPNVDTRFNEIESAVFSANALKAAGTRVVTVGVGTVFDDGQNLKAISGPVAGADYFTGSWEDLKTTLENIVLENCGGTVTVVKKVIPWDGTIAEAELAGGWDFDAPTVSTGTVSPNIATATADQGVELGTINYQLDDIPGGATFTLAEQQEPGYTLEQLSGANAVCSRNGGNAMTVSNSGALGFSITMGSGDIVSCTVYNKQPTPEASVVVHKQWVVDAADPIPDADFDIPGISAQLTLDDVDQGWGATKGGYTPGDTVVIDEDTADTNQYCSVTASSISADPSTLPHTATLAVGENSYTVTNIVTCTAKLTLLKEVIGNAAAGGTALPSAWTLTATANGQPGVSGASGVTGTVTPGVVYTLGEAGPDGYALSAVACGPSPNDLTVVGGTVTPVAHTTTYCRFTNTAVAPQLQLKKVVTGDVVDADNWLLTARDGATTVHSGNGLAPYKALQAGVGYALAESADAAYDEFAGQGWLCTDYSDAPKPVSLVGSVVTLALGQKVECVVTNTLMPPQPGFDKTAGTATANPDGTWDVTYTLTVTNPSAFASVTYSLDDVPAPPAGITGHGMSATLNGVAAVDDPTWSGASFSLGSGHVIQADGGPDVWVVTLTVAVPPGVDASVLDCSPNGMDNEATMTPTVGDPVTDDACVSIVPPVVSHTKSVTSVTQQPDTGQWRITYQVQVVATGSGVALYDLGDVLHFGAGITVISAAAAYPDLATPVAGWDGAGSPMLADDRAITAGATHTYTITVLASVAAGVNGTSAADCVFEDQEQGTGFFNTATLFANGDDPVDKDACGEPAGPDLDKSWISSTQHDDTSWSVTFQLEVENPSATTALLYSLSDLPEFLPGVTITARTVAFDGGAPSTWNGTDPLATDRPLAAGATDTYLLVFTVTVPAGLDESLLECSAQGAGHGFFNGATVTSGNDSIRDDDCGPAEDGILPLITKVVRPGFPKQLAGGDWAIEYTITVSTPDGNELAAVYDLEDELDFGDGIEVVTAAITGPGLATPNPWNGSTVTDVRSDVLLPAGQEHVYTVAVTARVGEGIVGSTAADCEWHQEETGTGFLNTATVRSGEVERAASDCASPGAPEFEKTLLGSPTKVSDNRYTIRYSLTVHNPSVVEVNYDLDDTLGFPGWVVVHSAVVTSDDVAVDPGWTGAVGHSRVVTGQALDPGETHVLLVTVVASPTVFAAPATLACVSGIPGHGAFNGAVVTSGDDVYPDDACAPLPPFELPTLPSSGSTPQVIAALGALLLLAGAALVAARARRRSEQ